MAEMDENHDKYSTDVATFEVSPTFSEENSGEKRSVRLVSEDKDAVQYAMDKQRRGRAVIFNNCKFNESTGLAERPLSGSNVDKENLQRAFSSLDFDVTVNDDCTTSEIISCIKDLASEDHEDEDCLVVVVITHGGVGGKLYAEDGSYKLDDLWKPFNALNCPSLAGKPKIFIVQSNRGDKVDRGLDLTVDGCCTSSGSTFTSSEATLQQIFSIPKECDFLIAQGAFEEYVSSRNDTCGSVFISNLCEVLEKDGRELHLIKMLTKTARKVMYSDDVQAPCFVSNLTRDVYFTHKTLSANVFTS